MKSPNLTPQQIIEILISPRSALDRLIACGTIDTPDLHSLKCCCVLSEQVSNITGKRAPNPAILSGLIDQIESGMEVLEDRIERCKQWLHDYAKYLRGVKRADLIKAIDRVKEFINGNN